MFYHLHKRILQFGTTKNLLGERGAIFGSQNKCCLIKPTSQFKTFWNILIVLLLVYTALFVPFKLAFIETDTQALIFFEILVDLIFGLDIIVNFLSATEDTNTN